LPVALADQLLITGLDPPADGIPVSVEAVALEDNISQSLERGWVVPVFALDYLELALPTVIFCLKGRPQVLIGHLVFSVRISMIYFG
jgi:hypothetical protein